MLCPNCKKEILTAPGALAVNCTGRSQGTLAVAFVATVSVRFELFVTMGIVRRPVVERASVALAMMEAVLRRLGATPEQIDRERARVHEELTGS